MASYAALLRAAVVSSLSIVSYHKSARQAVIPAACHHVFLTSKIAGPTPVAAAWGENGSVTVWNLSAALAR